MPVAGRMDVELLQVQRGTVPTRVPTNLRSACCRNAAKGSPDFNRTHRGTRKAGFQAHSLARKGTAKRSSPQPRPALLIYLFLLLKIVVVDKGKPALWTASFFPCGTTTCHACAAVRTCAFRLLPKMEQHSRSCFLCGQHLTCAETVPRVVDCMDMFDPGERRGMCDSLEGSEPISFALFLRLRAVANERACGGSEAIADASSLESCSSVRDGMLGVLPAHVACLLLALRRAAEELLAGSISGEMSCWTWIACIAISTRVRRVCCW